MLRSARMRSCRWAAASAGPLRRAAVRAAAAAGRLGMLPGLRTLRPRLAAIADGTDPVALRRLFASAMLTADPVVSGVCYVDDRFVPHAGAKPVGRGGTTSGAGPGKAAPTPTSAHDGRGGVLL